MSATRQCWPGALLLCWLALACAPEPAPLAVPALWFEDAVLEPPFVHSGAVNVGVALLDADGDGWTDLFLTNGRNSPDALYLNQGDGSFVDGAEAAGLADMRGNGAAVAGDLDNDGDTDLIVATECSTGTFDSDGTHLLDGDKTLYLNRGDGRFDRVPFALPESHAEALRQCATALHLADVDQDGFLDLVLANGIDPDVVPAWLFHKFDKTAQSWVLFGDGAGSFDEIAGDFGLEVAFTAASFDVDDDGANELVLGRSGATLQPWRLDGRANPQALPDAVDPARGVWMGLAPGDFDGDGDVDLWGSNQGLSVLVHGIDNLVGVQTAGQEWLHPALSFFEKEAGHFGLADWSVQGAADLAGDHFLGLDGRYPQWVAPEGLWRYAWGWAAVPLDIDADGHLDLAYVGNSCNAPLRVIWDAPRGAGPGALLRNLGGAPPAFEDLTQQTGFSNVDAEGRYPDGRGLVTGDLDRDGRPDLVVVNRMYNPSESDPLATVPGGVRVLLSRGQTGGWLQVQAQGTRSNRDALGARLFVEGPNGRSQWPIGAGGNTFGSSDPVPTIGLGDAESVDLELIFPSGAVVRVDGVAPNQRIVLEEPR
jgi:enediyne biosynthesis protein E4